MEPDRRLTTVAVLLSVQGVKPQREVDGIRLHNDNAADDLRSHLFADSTERSRLETARWQRYKLFIPSKPK